MKRPFSGGTAIDIYVVDTENVLIAASLAVSLNKKQQKGILKPKGIIQYNKKKYKYYIRGLVSGE